MPDKNDNLEQLLGGFLNEAEAREAAADIRRGEGLLSDYPAPRPDGRLVKEIKAKVSRSLATGRRRVHWAQRAVAVAAVIIAVSVLLLLTADQPRTIIADPGPDWWDDARVAGIRAEIDEVLDSMISISVDEYGLDESEPDFTEVEMEELEMVAMNDDFWKG